MIVAVAAAVVLGAMIGSFLTVVTHRVPARESIVAPGSACPHCGTPVSWRHNVPVLSWLWLRGRCAECATPIPVRYPALEAGTGVVFGTIVAARGLHPELALALPFAAMLIAVAVIDLEHRIVPNPILIVAVVVALVVGVGVDPGGMPERLAAGTAAFAAFLAIALIAPAGMGMGDVKLAGTMGLFLGLDVIPALLIAFLTGSVAGGVVMARGGVGERKTALPFAPFLALGGLAAILVGPELIDLYSDRFL